MSGNMERRKEGNEEGRKEGGRRMDRSMVTERMNRWMDDR